MEEDKRYYVGRITFTGNDTTRDKVIRREVYLNEGEVFNTEALKMSIRRINQLGYFKPMEGAPELKPSDLGDDKLDVVFKVEEQNRNQFTFGGGVSGLEGTFLNASFSTANFLGQGETLSLSAQTGRRTKNYQVALSEPYLFDRPITAGFDIFSRKITYESFQSVVGYTQEGTGASLMVGLPLGRFTRLFNNYSYEIINIAGLNDTLLPKDLDGDPATPNPEPATPPPVDPAAPVFDPFLLGEEGRRRESKFTPSFVHNTVDNPYTPRSGMKLTLTPQIAGGHPGRDGRLPEAGRGVHLLPAAHPRTSLGMRAQAAMHHPLRGHAAPAVLPALLPRRRDPDPRREHPDGGPDRERGERRHPRAGRQQVRPLQPRVLLRHRAGRCGRSCSSTPARPSSEASTSTPAQFRTSTGVEMRFIMPVLERPLPSHLRVEPEPGPVPEEVDLQVRGRHDFLRSRT